jgi:hypothetical protein
MNRTHYYPHWDWYGDERSGLDVSLPPWWTAIPMATPFGLGKWGADTLKQNIGSGGSRAPGSHSLTDWSTLLKVGFVVGVGLTAYLIYRGLRTSAVMSRESIRGALSSEGGGA